MNFWKRWLHIALVVVLTASLFSPAATTVRAEETVEQLVELTNEEAAMNVQLVVQGLHDTILPTTAIPVVEGANVYETLIATLQANNITYEAVESSFGPYIQAINGLSAGSLGGWDGWSYTVNGTSPDVGMADYILQADDVIRVYYGTWAALEATVNDRVATVNVKGDTFTAAATNIRNWQVPAGVKIVAITKVADQQVTLALSGVAGSYEVTALEKALTGGQQAAFTIELADSPTQHVIDLIAALPTMSEASEVNALLLKQARTAFDALTEEQKAQVSNSSTLVTRENRFLQLALPKAIEIDAAYRAYLSPKYSTSVTDYTLNVPTEFKEIVMNATTTHEDVNVTYAIGSTVYEAGTAIPVTNNKTVTITTSVAGISQQVNVKFKTLKPVTMKVDFRVEGIAGTKLNVKDFEVTGDGTINATQATKQILDAHHIAYTYSESADYFREIAGDGERGLGAGSGWMYKVNGSYPDVYASATTVKAGDEIVWDYINSFSLIEDLNMYGIVMRSGAESEDKVTFNPIIDMPTAVVEGTDVRIKVTGKYNRVSYLYEAISGPHTVQLADVTIELNDKKYVTDAQGEVTIPAADLQAGSYELRFTKDLPGTIFTDSGDKQVDAFPRIIRTYKPLFVTATDAEAQNRQAAEQALALSANYLVANAETVSNRVNESHSGFWMMAAMRAASIDPATFSWTTLPTAEGTFWTTAVEQSTNNANTIAGTIIAAKALGLDPTNLKGRNQVEDLLALQKESGLFSTIWGEAFALIALQLADAQYDEQKQIDAILKLQNATTGYFGDNDATGWTLFALSAFKDDPAVKAAIDKAVEGVHANIMANGFIDNANSLAAIVSGLGAVGENIFTDKWSIVQNGEYVNLGAYLAKNYVMEDGGVRWKMADTKSNLMALEQVYIALYDALNGQSAFYAIGEKIEQPVTPTPEQPTNPGTGGGEVTPPAPTTQSVTMSIAASASEVMLPSETFNIVADETAFELLQRVTTAKSIALNARKTSLGMYVAGIGGLNEFDRGRQSGWMYRVNGEFPEQSADVYKLQDGDIIEWVYTEDLGEDVGSVTPVTPVTPPTTTQPEPQTAIIKFTAQQLAQPEVTVTLAEGMTVTLPTAGMTFAQNESLAIIVQQQAKETTVELQVVNEKGETKPFALTKGYAKLTFNTTASSEAAGQLVVFQQVNSERQAVPHTIVEGKVTVFTKTGGTFVTATANVTFSDLANVGHHEEITYLANRYVVKGSNGKFMPTNNITRGQFALMIARALNLQATVANPFTDTAGKEYEQAITALYEAGITTGRTATTFDPQGYVTRQQAAAFMARVLAYVEKKPATIAQVSYHDAAAIGSIFVQDVALLAQLDIMSGKLDGTFDPHGYLTRVQMAKILKRTLSEAGMM